MANQKTSWFYESANQRKNSDYVETGSSFAPCQKDGVETFDDRFGKICEMYEDGGLDIRKDITTMIGDKNFMEQYKKDLMTPVVEGFRAVSPGDPHIESVIKNCETYWDTKVKMYNESASLASFLPIATLEFPVLVKQFYASILKDIIEVEAVSTPNISKHIRTTYMVDNQTGEEYEYPKCLFDGTWEKIWNASKGLPIKEVVVPLTNGRLYKYDIIAGVTDGTPGIDQLTWQFKIIAVEVGGDVINIPGNGITIEFSTGGTLVNGDLDFEYNGTKIQDTLGGQVDFKNGTISISSASGQVTGVVFSGYLSNEKNLRHASVREKRDVLRFTIEDGARWNMPFSIEEIEDAAALLDMNYYNRMVDEVVRCQEMQECMYVIKFLNDEYKKFSGVKADIFKLESMALAYEVDLTPPAYFAGDPFKYYSSVIQFKLRAIINQITDMVKLDELSFILVGNPMATQLLEEFNSWKIQSGTTIGGIKVNGSYGFGTNMGGNVRTVATNLFDAYSVDPVEKTGKRELILHGYVYPTDKEHMAYKHLKYTSHLFTSQSQTAYQSTQAPGGAYNIVTATARFHAIAVQGIQFTVVFLNSDRIYGDAPTRPPIMGAPWDGAMDTTPATPPVGP